MLFSRLSVSLLTAVLFRIAGADTTEPVCVTESQPNPIKDVYPDEVTGLLNATLAIAAIPLRTARRIVPYPILESAYRSLLPDFPQGMYPVFVQAAYDHGINYQGYAIPDFSRFGYEFPFLDFLGNGYSSFRWAPEQFITSSNELAIQGSQSYGTIVNPSKFKPECNAYGEKGEPYFKAKSTNNSDYVSLNFHVMKRNPVPSPQLLDFFKNVTNQATFANGTTCDQQIRFFNTSVTEAPFAPVAVRGTITSRAGPFKGEQCFEDVRGIQVATAFIERNYLDCSTLAGL